jgi:hypothetical protein
LNNGIEGETGPKEQQIEYSIKFLLKENSDNEHWIDVAYGRIRPFIKMSGAIIDIIS